MMKYFLMAISILLFSCSSDGIFPNDEHAGYDSKLKKETWRNWDHSLKFVTVEKKSPLSPV